MSHDHDPENWSHHLHSHSTLTKVIEELDSLLDVLEENPRENALWDEFREFADQLVDEIEGHIEYEESDLFPQLDGRLDADGTMYREAAIEQHRGLEHHLERLLGHLRDGESGAREPQEVVGNLRDHVDVLDALFREHDRTEAELFATVGGDPEADESDANLPGPYPPAHDVLVVGAGVVGLAVGWQLVRQGFDVLVVERDRPGVGASSAAAGMLAPTAEAEFGEDDMFALQRESLEMYPDFVEAIRETTGFDVGFRRQGTLMVARDRDESEALDRLYRHHRELGATAEKLSAAEVSEREPGLRDVQGGVFLPDDHQVDNRRLVDGLKTALTSAGGELREHTPVDSLWYEEDELRGVELVEADDEQSPRRLRADRVVIAAGAWSGHFDSVPELGGSTLRPVRGEAVAVDIGDPPVCEHVLRCPDVYLVPRDDELVVGATSFEKGFEQGVTVHGVRDSLQEAWRLLPGIDECGFRRAWSGLRPVTLDSAPLVGPSQRDGVWLATGHGRHGILLAPWTARQLADDIAETTRVADEWPLVAPDRFQ